ncbi:MAG: MEDS domain-containing protein [Terriglobales bacterium]
MSISNVTSPMPPPRWHDHGPHAHVVQFYAEDAALLDAVSRFLGTALGAGDAALVIATQEHRDGLSLRLKERGFDLAGAIRRGLYVVVDAADTLSQFMVDGGPDPARFACVVGDLLDRSRSAAKGKPPQVAAFGEMVALLWAQGKPEAAIQLEELWNDLARTHSFRLHCAYPMASFNRDEYSEPFLKICASHSAVIPVESYAALPGEEERLRSISYLQQKEQVLETVKAERSEARDSLHRKQAELADLLENAVEGVQQVGSDQKILWANKALLNLLGYSAHEDEYVGRQLSDFYIDRNVFAEYWQRLLRGEDIYDFPAELRYRDGSIKQVQIYSNGLWENGEFIHARCFVRDVTEQKRAQQALRESEANLRLANDKLESVVELRTVALRRLSTRVLNMQDAERRRIARELHDSLGQYMVGLKLNLDLLRQSPGQPGLWAKSEELMERCVSEIRTLSYLLHPPMIDDVGLPSAARWFVEGMSQRSGIRVTLEAPGDLARLPAEIELLLFRVLQEGLTNVHRHSGASAAEVLIRQENGQVLLQIKDNGCGITQQALTRFDQTGTGMGVGLSGMRERVRELGGRMKLEADSHGTALQIAIPVTPNPHTTT